MDPPSALAETVGRYNEACKSGNDQEFHRSSSTLKPIDTPPYYGIGIWEALGNTQGGPRRNSKCQVLDMRGNPIHGLYSAGSLGSIWGFLYQGGGNIAECLASGRVAGREAAESSLRA
ncbi:MAG TPA: FAD-binding protein [Nitrososphaerales archaeon]|nr:FAD-binding protein [Nitrososphaerales archaeon]